MGLDALKKRAYENVALGRPGMQRETLSYQRRVGGPPLALCGIVSARIDTDERGQRLADTQHLSVSIGRDPTAACGGLAEPPAVGDILTRADGRRLAVAGDVAHETPWSWAFRAELLTEHEVGVGRR